MSEYTPDRWVILKIDYNEETLYKVLAGWSGGYLDGDSWRMNSGITKVVEKSHHYEFHGSSGSVYRCGRKRYGFNAASSGIWDKIQREGLPAELMHEDTLWRELFNED